MSNLSVVRFQYDTMQPLIVSAQVADLATLPPVYEDFDSTGYSLAFRMVKAGASAADTPKVNDAAATQPAVGFVQYDWDAADVDTDGEFHAWFVVTRVIDSKVTFFPALGSPIRITFRPVQGGAP